MKMVVEGALLDCNVEGFVATPNSLSSELFNEVRCSGSRAYKKIGFDIVGAGYTANVGSIDGNSQKVFSGNESLVKEDASTVVTMTTTTTPPTEVPVVVSILNPGQDKVEIK